MSIWFYFQEEKKNISELKRKLFQLYTKSGWIESKNILELGYFLEFTSMINFYNIVAAYQTLGRPNKAMLLSKIIQCKENAGGLWMLLIVGFWVKF